MTNIFTKKGSNVVNALVAANLAVNAYTIVDFNGNEVQLYKLDFMFYSFRIIFIIILMVSVLKSNSQKFWAPYDGYLTHYAYGTYDFLSRSCYFSGKSAL